jgi:hypothetical protein
MRQEADGGNADAQYTLATMYNNGRGIARDRETGPGLAGKGRRRRPAERQPDAGTPADAGRAASTRRSRNCAPPSTSCRPSASAPLWLYNARVRKGEAALAKTELAASLKKQRNDDWPEPIAEFYLGKLDAKGCWTAPQGQAVRARAHLHGQFLYARMACGARRKPQAEALLATLRADCGPARPAAPAPASAAAPTPAPAAAP